MAAMDFDATLVPRDIVAGLSLATGTRYTVQHVGVHGTMFVRESAAEPAPSARAFRVEAGVPVTIEPDGEPIWFWTDEPDGVPVLVNAAP